LKSFLFGGKFMGIVDVSDTADTIFQFGEFRLDVRTRELRTRGAPVHISPKAFELLLYLLEQRPRAVSKDELLDRIWPKTFISEATLTSVIAEIREVLSDRARQPRFVRTVHRFGYAFCGAVSHPPAALEPVCPSVCFLLGEAGELMLTEGENVLGREGSGTIALNAATVSRRHARIVVTGDEATVEDLGSKNGTFLRGDRLTAAARLCDGDRLLIGAVPLLFRVRRSAETTLTRPAGEDESRT
jgi:DNA-binding winged helix-turn-helix (wHTH) protein